MSQEGLQVSVDSRPTASFVFPAEAVVEAGQLMESRGILSVDAMSTAEAVHWRTAWTRRWLLCSRDRDRPLPLDLLHPPSSSSAVSPSTNDQPPLVLLRHKVKVVLVEHSSRAQQWNMRVEHWSTVVDRRNTKIHTREHR